MMAGIVVEKLSKSFKNIKAVNNISFKVEEGRVLGFLGPNGAGKTTTLRMLVGLSKPDQGKINIAGNPILFGSSQNNALFGYLPEQPSFYGWMTGTEYLRFIAEIFHLEKIETKVKEVLKTVDLTDAGNRRIAGYSNGMKQRLGIAQALINDPSVLIMDEPVSALDPIGRREVLHVISRLRNNKTVLFSTHILSDVDRICDDIIIINRGKIVAAAPLTELKEKYARPILEVEFAGDAEYLIGDLKKESWVENIEARGNALKIWLTGDSIIEQNIPLKYFVDKGLSILKYGLILPEVEDLFLNLIEEDK